MAVFFCVHRLAPALLAVGVTLACGEPVVDLAPGIDVPGASQRPHALQGGIAVADVPALPASMAATIGVLVQSDGALRCTATLVSPRHIVTARHCLAVGGAPAALELSQALAALTFFLDPSVEGTSWPLAAATLNEDLDLAVLTLGAMDDAERTLLPLAVASSGAALAGASVVVIGAGRGTPVEWTLAAGTFAVTAVGPSTLTLASLTGAGLCPGDSGSPVLHFDDDGPALVAVHSSGFVDCAPPSTSIRLDIATAWLSDAIAQAPASSAPCDDSKDLARCEGTIAGTCRHGYWREVDCALGRFACEVVADVSSCVPIPCGDVPPAGRCQDGVARVCSFGSLREDDCRTLGLGCAFDVVSGRHACQACDACDGACVDLRADPFHCGACDVVCAPDGRGRCIEGSCAQRDTADAGPSAPADGGGERPDEDDGPRAGGCAAAHADRADVFFAGVAIALLVYRRARRRVAATRADGPRSLTSS